MIVSKSLMLLQNTRGVTKIKNVTFKVIGYVMVSLKAIRQKYPRKFFNFSFNLRDAMFNFKLMRDKLKNFEYSSFLLQLKITLL